VRKKLATAKRAKVTTHRDDRRATLHAGKFFKVSRRKYVKLNFSFARIFRTRVIFPGQKHFYSSPRVNWKTFVLSYSEHDRSSSSALIFSKNNAVRW